MKKDADKRTTRVAIVVSILIVAVVGYYCHLVNRPVKEAEEKELTVIDEVLLRNLAHDYPPTVKEVVKYHNEITKCLYNEECEQEDFENLLRRDRELYDNSLLLNNEWDTHTINLLAEVTAFRNAKRKLTGAKVGASTDVDYFEKDGHSFARISCSYTIMEGTKSTTTLHIFLLRKDANGHWKIYGWDLADNVELEENETEGQKDGFEE